MKRANDAKRGRGRPPASQEGLLRERLLESALDLFAKRGFDGVTVEEIARSARASGSALYAHFDGKRALYDALFEREGPAAVALAIAARGRERAESPRVFVEGLATDLIGIWSKPRSRRFTSIFVRELATRGQGGLALHAGIDAALDALAVIIGGWRGGRTFATSASDRELAWELLAPLVYVRFVYLQSHATRADCETAATAALRHARFFLESAGLGAGPPR